MTTPDPAVLAALAAECHEQDHPRGVIFLGLAQLQNGGCAGPAPAGGLVAIEAQVPLVAAAAGNGVVVLALDLQGLNPLPP